MEKDLEDDGDIVMRTETCGKDNEPIDKVYKDLMDSSLCQMESIGDDDVRIEYSVGPSPQRHSSRQSPELLYVPGHAKVSLCLE